MDLERCAAKQAAALFAVRDGWIPGESLDDRREAFFGLVVGIRIATSLCLATRVIVNDNVLYQS
ncbi:MAG: hypothetical protein M3N02_08925 [Pseudomonadota bacterium]|nr:hypothetical protein [Pseudomonadota bacterium]